MINNYHSTPFIHTEILIELTWLDVFSSELCNSSRDAHQFRWNTEMIRCEKKLFTSENNWFLNRDELFLLPESQLCHFQMIAKQTNLEPDKDKQKEQKS